MKVYGPYTSRRTGRKHVILVDDEGKRRTVSYPKYLLELAQGRRLDPDLETADHRDDNFRNDDPANLEVMTRADNARKAAWRRPTLMGEYACAWCGAMFLRAVRIVIRNHVELGKPGPFCGKQCAGRHNVLQRPRR